MSQQLVANDSLMCALSQERTVESMVAGDGLEMLTHICV